MPTLETITRNHLTNLREQERLRHIVTYDNSDGIFIEHEGKRLISFCSNDYLGLSHFPKIKQAAIDAVTQYGVGGCASRLVTGNHPYYKLLEERLAQMKNTEASLVFGSGYLANIGVIPALVGKDDLIIADRLVHSCLIDGARLSGANLLRFAHNDVAKCAELLSKYRSQYKRCLILTETVFSMDGDLGPIDELAQLAEHYEAWLLTDDAHGLGIATPAYTYTAHIQMGTLSKAVGSYGGYVCASHQVIHYLSNSARSLIFSTALPPAIVAAAYAALGIIQANPNLTEYPLHNARTFTQLLGLPEAQSAIVPLILGSEERALQASKLLQEEGFLVWPIRPPTVPAGTSRLRFTFSALHNTEDITALAQALRKHGFA